MSPDVQQRVLESAEALGYQLNLLGRALRQQRLSIIGLVVPDLQNPFFAALSEQLALTLRAGGFDLLVSSAGGDVSTELRGVQSFLGQQIHALIVIPSDEVRSEAGLMQAQDRVRTIQFDRRVISADVPYVGCDNARGMELIAAHVKNARAADPSEVIYVGADPNSSSGHERAMGFRRFFPDALHLSGSFDAAWGREAIDMLLRRGTRRGILVAAADVIAVGMLSALQAAGFRVPDDFRVVGFDGIGVTALAQPALTTVEQPVAAMTETIFELIREGASPIDAGEWLLPPRLVVGASSPE